MASSSQKVSGNLTGMELVPYVPNAKTKNDDQALLAIEQPPVMISLIKQNSRRHARSRAPQVPDEISFKLPQKCYANLFVSAEKREGEAGLRNILWSAPVDFRLPENNMNQILKRDEDVRSTYGVGPLPLTERLAGWKVEKRQRPRLERYDKFFYHKSGGQFRTFPEVVRFINHASLPKRAPQRIKAQNQSVLALEAPGSEPSQAASLKRTRPLPISIGSTSNRLKYGTKNKGLRSWANDWKDHRKLPDSTNGTRSAFFAGNRSPQVCFTLQMVVECLERDKRRCAIPISIGSTERLNYGTKNKGLRSSANGFSVGNKSSQACFTLQMVTEFLERDKKRRADKNLRHYDKQKEKEKETASSEVTPRMTPERGREGLRRFNNEECNMPQGNQANMRNEEGEISIIILSDDSEQEIEGETIIPDLFIPDEDWVGLEDFE
ncbi:uncharacterized protein LOC131327885 [Rhododendron vialii]|uniref:uncharacterized protein LOC131327885 n=1 Tax=Rhododendron vialii TaxID=182163 RepID=UPI0026604E37|nr:uncharacterized protein LOC131327885 [Rhododendron vialii]